MARNKTKIPFLRQLKNPQEVFEDLVQRYGEDGVVVDTWTEEQIQEWANLGLLLPSLMSFMNYVIGVLWAWEGFSGGFVGEDSESLLMYTANISAVSAVVALEWVGQGCSDEYYDRIEQACLRHINDVGEVPEIFLPSAWVVLVQMRKGSNEEERKDILNQFKHVLEMVEMGIGLMSGYDPDVLN